MRLLLILIAVFAPAAQAAARPPPLPLEDLARGPAVAAIAVSPDGRRLARIETVEGRGAIVLTDGDGGSPQVLIRDPERSITNVAWSGDGRWLFYLQDAGGNEGYHLIRVDPDAANPVAVDLTPFAGTAVELIATQSRTGAIVLATLNRRDPEWPDAMAIDLNTGTIRELVRNDGSITEYFGTSDGTIAAASAIRQDGTLDVRVPQSGGWRTIYSAAPNERFKLLTIVDRGMRAIARSNRGRSREEFISIDLSSGAFRSWGRHSCGQFDAGDVRVNAAGDPLITSCVMESAKLFGHTARLRTAISAARRLAGARAGLAIESASADLSTLIFYVDGGARAPAFIRYRAGAGARMIDETRPWLSGRSLAPSQAYWLRARDGLRLLTYVTRPPARTDPAPTVIAIHGGPWDRDNGGFEGTTQMLASRGYAVIQVNFRGSTGLGRAVFEGGVGEFGGRMSDDIDDAYDWAVRAGIADGQNVCLLGGSYGGFAVLSGLTRRTRPYRCGIDFAGPVNLVTLVEAFPPSWQPFLPRSWYRFVGDPRVAANRERMVQRSPLTHVDQLNVPLLVFQGANDPRVTQSQSDQIVCALRRRDIPVTYLLSANEGHSFTNEETSLAVNRATELFLARHLGGVAQQDASEVTNRALSQMTEAGNAIVCP